MRTDATGGPTILFSPRLRTIVAIAWVAGVALVYLLRYDAWVLPIQFFHLAAAALPTLRFGPHFHEFSVVRLRDLACVAAVLAAAFPVGAIAVARLAPDRNF